MAGKVADTLAQDILNLLDEGVEDIQDDALLELSKSIASHLKSALSKEERKRKPTLRMSNIGKPCNRQLWYDINEPEYKESLPPEARLKFLYGHILEDIMLFLAEASGHTVTGRQDELEVNGVLGHRDAVIDGVVFDVKSASSYSFQKFANHGLEGDDPFGYIDQTQGYLEAGQEDDLVTDKDRVGFLVVDKTLGKVCTDFYPRKKFPIRKLIDYKKDVVARDDPPARGFDPVPEGKSGNMKLPLNCSYCDFKFRCHPGLKQYNYAKGPVFLTKVVKEPRVGSD